MFLLIASLTFGQGTPENKVVVIKNDTFALVNKNDIILSEQKYRKNELDIILLKDSLKQLNAIINNYQNKIHIKNKFIEQKDTSYSILKNIYAGLQKDFNKLKNPKLNIFLGGGVAFNYNAINPNMVQVAIKLNLGLLVSKKYLASIDVGLSTNSDILIGLNSSIIF